MATKNTASLSFQQQLAACANATERLALYRAAAKTISPSQPKTTWAERTAKIGAGVMNFGSNVKSVYTIEREIGRM